MGANAKRFPGEVWRGSVLVDSRERDCVVAVRNGHPLAAILDRGEWETLHPLDRARGDVLAAWAMSLYTTQR